MVALDIKKRPPPWSTDFFLEVFPLCDVVTVATLRGVEGNPQRERIPVPPSRWSAFVFRFQSHATITIPTSESMNIAAAASTGDFRDGIMIGK
jgi:hypothetical protein